MGSKVKDSYILKLGEIASEIEKAYGLAEVNEMGLAYAKLDIEDVISHVSGELKKLPKEEVFKRNQSAGRAVVLAAYISGRLSFFGKVKLDYSEYPRMSVVAGILLAFTKKKTVTEYNYRQLNKIITVLAKVDQKFINHRFGLGYRYLRIFLLLILYGSYSNAGIIASFILDQFIAKGD